MVKYIQNCIKRGDKEIFEHLVSEGRIKEICGDEYVNLWHEKSTLDGRFSAEQLRKIADLMDELKEDER